jgi:hypothetical protein
MRWRWWLIVGDVVEWLMWWVNVVVWQGGGIGFGIEVVPPLAQLWIQPLLLLAEDTNGTLQYC